MSMRAAFVVIPVLLLSGCDTGQPKYADTSNLVRATVVARSSEARRALGGRERVLIEGADAQKFYDLYAARNDKSSGKNTDFFLNFIDDKGHDMQGRVSAVTLEKGNSPMAEFVVRAIQNSKPD